MRPRPYQVAGVDRIIELMRAGCRSLVRVLPTGAGKTVEAALLARRVKGDRRILFLVHRRELVRQAVETLATALPGEQIGIVAAGWPAIPWARVQVGSVQSLARRINQIAPPHVVYIDEAHHARAATWETVLRAWPRARLIGLTATPERLDGLGLGEWFSEIVEGPPVGELIDAGYLAPTSVLQVSWETASSFRGSNQVGDAVDAIQRHAVGRRAIFFGRTVDHSRAVCEALRAAGIRAEHVDGTDSDARRDRLTESFREGGIDVLGNCQLFDEGFDVPAADTVVVGRQTGSTTRWLQMCGRAMRPGPGKQALILDLGGSSHWLGQPTDRRTWTLEDGEVREQSRSRRAGPREGKASEPVDQVVVDLQPATSGATVPPAGGRRGAAKRPAAKTTRRDLARLIRAAKREPDPLGALARIAQELGYRPGWVGHMARIHGVGEA